MAAHETVMCLHEFGINFLATAGVSATFVLPKRIINVNARDFIYYPKHFNIHCSSSSYFEEWKFKCTNNTM
jgi:hypothetical protein